MAVCNDTTECGKCARCNTNIRNNTTKRGSGEFPMHLQGDVYDYRTLMRCIRELETYMGGEEWHSKFVPTAKRILLANIAAD